MVPSSKTLPYFGRFRGTAKCDKFTRTEEEFDVKSARIEPIENQREQYYLKLSLYFYLLNFWGTRELHIKFSISMKVENVFYTD